MENFISTDLITIVIICNIISAILYGILFWKIWYMCNNVNKLTNHFCKDNNSDIELLITNDHKSINDNNEYKINDQVRILGTIKSGIIKSIRGNDIYVSIDNGPMKIYNPNEITKID